MNLIEITDISLPELAPFLSLTESGLRGEGLIVAESPKVIERALDKGVEPVALLCEKRHIEGDARGIAERLGDIPIYTGSRETLSSLTGYTLTRGVLCAMRQPCLPSTDSLLKEARRICVIYDVSDSTNVGVIFRSAAALGFDCILVSPRTCSPYNRRVIRVSMGTVFQIPWTVESGDMLGKLKEFGFKTVATALTPNSISLGDFKPEDGEKYAVILGEEGYGLPSSVISESDFSVMIPMHHGVDSLNVGAAAAILLWHFSKPLSR